MSWMMMQDGTRCQLHPSDVASNAYSPATLAHHIAQINRFTGACSRPYSVAEHSLLCADIAAADGMDAATQLACLVHDLHEAIVGDVSTPMKRVLGPLWQVFERRHQNQMLRALGVTWYWQVLVDVRWCDRRALATERRDLLQWPGADAQPWPGLDDQNIEPVATNLLAPWRAQRTWGEWCEDFLARLDGLRATVRAEREQHA